MSLQCGFLSACPMSKRRLADGDQNARPDEKDNNQNVYWNALVFFSACVMSHCGFLLSLLAIWLAWLVPAAILGQPAAPDFKALKSRAKHPRSRPVRPLSSNAPPNLASIILPTNAADNEHEPTRHVYFADAHATTVKDLAMVAEPPPQAPVIPQSSTPSPPEASPQLSATGMLPSEIAADRSESFDSLVLDSDSSSRPSSLRRPGLKKFKLFRSYSLDVTPTSTSSDVEVSSPVAVATPLLKGQRASLPSSKPTKPPPTRFHFRRCTAPVGKDPPPRTPKPRTMPYGPPYFAAPPILLDRHASSTRAQFKDEVLNSRSPESDSELSRGRTIRRVNLSSTVDKRHTRSMSEDTANFVIPP